MAWSGNEFVGKGVAAQSGSGSSSSSGLGLSGAIAQILISW
jgi:hypothetical protein